MDTSSNEAVLAQSSTAPAAAIPIDKVGLDEGRKHFDTFENHFFQQGDEAELASSGNAYDDPDAYPRDPRLLSYRTMVGLTIASTTVAVLACIALLTSNPPRPEPVVVAPSKAPTVAVVAPTAPSLAPAIPAPVAVRPSPEAPGPAAALAAAQTAVAAPPSAPSPETVAPAAPPSDETSAPHLAETEAAKAEGPHPAQAEAEGPTPVAAPTAVESEAQSRCQQSIRGKRAKDITTACAAAFAEDTSNADAAVAVAKVEFDRGRFAQAYAWSKKAIAVNPATPDAYVFAGGAEQNQGHDKAAKEAYQHYLRLAPGGRYAAELRTIVNSL